MLQWKMFAFHLVSSRNKSSRLYLISAKNDKFFSSGQHKLIYSDFEIVVWWQPNWSPIFLRKYMIEYIWLYTQQNIFGGLGEWFLRQPSTSLWQGTYSRFTEFSPISIIRNCKVEWKSIKKCLSQNYSATTLAAFYRCLIYFSWKTI